MLADDGDESDEVELVSEPEEGAPGEALDDAPSDSDDGDTNAQRLARAVAMSLGRSLEPLRGAKRKGGAKGGSKRKARGGGQSARHWE